MKSKGKAKKSIKNITDFKTKKYTDPSPNAINLNYYVEVLHYKAGWVKAKILECKLLPKFKTQPDSEREESSYSYYVHLVHTNRRNDHWTDMTKMKKLDEFIDEANKEFYNSSDSEAEEGEGMDAADRAIHEAATRI